MGLIWIFAIPSIFISIDFLKYLLTGKRFATDTFNQFFDVIIILLLVLIYFGLVDANVNDCCGDTATFSPEHKMTIIFHVSIILIAFIISSFKRHILSPIVEIIINTLIFWGIIFNVIIACQINSVIFLFGNLPIILLFIYQLFKNQKLIIEYIENSEIKSDNILIKLSWKFLRLKMVFKIPILFILCIPILIIISAILLIFGQKPDSFIQAFTETYRHGFSQLDYQCKNIECGGHFLCSIAANGHKDIVKPFRLGERKNKLIICNRQLLVSNAFEELIYEKFPKFHKIIRTNYNKVGLIIHKHYWLFGNKYLSDFIYIAMKPFEYIFLFCLYSFDLNPENRIARQYTKMK